MSPITSAVRAFSHLSASFRIGRALSRRIKIFVNGQSKSAAHNDDIRHTRFHDGTSCHSTKQPKYNCQMAGYLSASLPCWKRCIPNSFTRKAVLLFFALIISTVSPAYAEFTGTFDLSPTGCEATGLCKLTYNLIYKDPKKIEWQADAQDSTDGATIPAWAQPFIGKPFDKSYIKAAVIHDHYCVRQVRPWRQTHRVFYDALVELGIDSVKSKLMYYAVYLGGPKWAKLMPGKTCGTNSSCINTFSTSKVIMQTRPANYENKAFLDDVKEVEKLLSERGNDISLEALEQRALSKLPNDFYFKHGDVVEINSGLQTE